MKGDVKGGGGGARALSLAVSRPFRTQALPTSGTSLPGLPHSLGSHLFGHQKHWIVGNAKHKDGEGAPSRETSTCGGPVCSMRG